MSSPLLPPEGEILLYQTEDGRTRIECRFENETLWLSQALIAELFQKDVRTINEHLQNIYEEDELDPAATIRKFRIVRREGNPEVGRLIEHYSEEIRELNRIVTMWLDFAEDQARRRKQVFLKSWETKLEEFLRFNERAILPNAGKISKLDADSRAEAEYDRFAARRRALLATEGERTNIKSLEDTAKALPIKKKKWPPKKPDSME